jgi:glycosyltransferase involved in cell wall biosynthesis
MSVEGRSIVAFSSNDWSDIPSSTSQLMTYLGRRNRILCIDTLGIRTPTVSRRDFQRALGKVRRAAAGVKQVDRNIFVWSPLVVPFHGSAVARKVNGAYLAGAVRRRMKALGMRDPIVYTALPSAVDAVVALRASGVVYHCVDDYREFTGAPREAYEVIERRLLEHADLTVVSAKRLYELRAPSARRIEYLPHGVDLAAFEQELEREVALPDVEDVRTPIAGFVGRIGDWIDVDLVASCARQMPDWTFVMIGPTNVPLSRFEGIPNLRFLGAKDHSQIPHYLRRFDVCLLPFVENDVTTSVNPLKLYEYLAVGKPVVSVPMPEVESFRDVVEIVPPDGFPAAIRHAAADDDSGAARRRKERVAQFSWGAIAEQMIALLDAELERRGGRGR